MVRSAIKRSGLFFITICLATLPVVQSAQAAIITTDTAIEISDRGMQIDRVTNYAKFSNSEISFESSISLIKN